MKYKYMGFVFTTLIMGTLIISILLIGGTHFAYKTIINFKVSNEKMECLAIDHGLELYSDKHRQINTDSVSLDDKENLKYSFLRKYPEKLSDLKELQEHGYISKNIDLDDSALTYTTNDDRSKYLLKYKLSSGYVYQSQYSTLE